MDLTAFNVTLLRAPSFLTPPKNREEPRLAKSKYFKFFLFFFSKKKTHTHISNEESKGREAAGIRIAVVVSGKKRARKVLLQTRSLRWQRCCGGLTHVGAANIHGRILRTSAASSQLICCCNGAAETFSFETGLILGERLWRDVQLLQHRYQNHLMTMQLCNRRPN